MYRILTLCCILALAGSASAQLYKHVDKDGRVTYSDQPPADAQAKSLKINPTPPSPPQRTALEREKEAEKARSQSTDKAKADEEAARKAQVERENCRQAELYLRTVTDGGRITTYDDKGERVLLDDKQIEDERLKAEKAVKENCKGS